jgi:hypothetical protein
MFKLNQSKPSGPGGHAVTVLRLAGGSFGGCEAVEDKGRPAIGHLAAVVARARRRTVRKLWGSETGGSWSTSGSQAAATVRGTEWMTEDNCFGTYVLVTRGVVLVHSFATGRTVRVTAGHSYLARAPDRG